MKCMLQGRHRAKLFICIIPPASHRNWMRSLYYIRISILQMKTDSPCGCEMPTLKISWEWCHVWVPRSPATSHHSQGNSQFTTVSRVSGDTSDHSYSTLRVLEAGNASTCPFIPRAVPGTEQKLTKNLLNVDCVGNSFRPLLLRDKSNVVSVFTGFHQAFYFMKLGFGRNHLIVAYLSPHLHQEFGLYSHLQF